MMSNDTAMDVAAARSLLKAAQDALSEAVAALPRVEGETAMATPALLALLVRVVKTKQELGVLELLLANEVASAASTSPPR
jgi:hypothetical protein